VTQAGPGEQCVILVGGRGTRLGALTDQLPKPLMSVGGRPFLDYLVAEAWRHGFKKILFLAGYRGEALQVAARDLTARYDGLKIDVVIEPEPLGTGGAVKFALDKLDDAFLLMNGDSLFDINLLDLATRPVSGAWSARLALKPGMDPGRYGSVAVDGDRVLSFAEKRASAELATINGGVYWIARDAIASLPDGACSLERDLFPALAAKGLLRAFSYDRFMLDIGLPESLAAADELVPRQTRRAAVFFDRDGTLNVDHGYVHTADKFDWMPGAIAAIKAVNDSGRFAFVVTNQAGVARGYYDETHVAELHTWVNAQLRAHGAHIDDFAYCPHHPEGVRDRYRQVCQCRKPEPGMIMSLAIAFSVDMSRSIMVGDKDIDVQAARAAGIAGHLFTDGNLHAFLTERAEH